MEYGAMSDKNGLSPSQSNQYTVQVALHFMPCIGIRYMVNSACMHARKEMLNDDCPSAAEHKTLPLGSNVNMHCIGCTLATTDHMAPVELAHGGRKNLCCGRLQ